MDKKGRTSFTRAETKKTTSAIYRKRSNNRPR